MRDEVCRPSWRPFLPCRRGIGFFHDSIHDPVRPWPMVWRAEQWFSMPITCGIGPGIIAYATHPSAKGLPKPWQERFQRWFDYWGMRSLVGIASGGVVAWPFFLVAVAATSTFGLAHWDDPIRWRRFMSQPEWTIDIVTISTIVRSGVHIPYWHCVRGPLSGVGRDSKIWKFAARIAIAGLFIGAWIPDVLVWPSASWWTWGYVGRSHEQSINWLAGCCGVFGGIAVAVALRNYRKNR